MNNEYQKKPIVITMGDVAGIGPEIIARAYLRHPNIMQNTVVVGSGKYLSRSAKLIKGVQDQKEFIPIFEIDTLVDAASVPCGGIPILNLDSHEKYDHCSTIAYGKASSLAGRMSGVFIKYAAQLTLRHEASAMVTAPLCKESLNLASGEWLNFPGHTELLQNEVANFKKVTIENIPVRMMLCNDELSVVLVSIHVPLLQAIQSLSIEKVFKTIDITHQAFSAYLGREPRIAVAGLNPHAGEGGLFGREEIDIIMPACEMARNKGWRISGPIAPDTVFMRARKKACDHDGEFDVVIAMYHDQGLIPVKYLGVDQGVNVTLGLDLIRTSPDHGTAFDIAAKGIASELSLISAIKWAKNCVAMN